MIFSIKIIVPGLAMRSFQYRLSTHAPSYAILEKVSAQIELLRGELANDAGDRDLVTAQLAVEF
jgi:hypothetical protein